MESAAQVKGNGLESSRLSSPCPVLTLKDNQYLNPLLAHQWEALEKRVPIIIFVSDHDLPPGFQALYT